MFINYPPCRSRNGKKHAFSFFKISQKLCVAADSFHKSADNRRNVTACTVIVEGAHPVLRSSQLGFHTYIIHSPPHSTLCGQKRAFIECGLSTQNALQRQPPHRIIQLAFLRLKVLRYTAKDNLSRHRTVSTSSFHKEFCQRKCSHHSKFEIIFIIIPEICSLCSQRQKNDWCVFFGQRKLFSAKYGLLQSLYYKIRTRSRGLRESRPYILSFGLPLTQLRRQ